MIERIIIKNFKGIKEADISFHDKINVIVGNNGVGKSTLIEAISLTLGHGIGQLEITQYLFHESTWKDFESNKVLPEIIIELYFNKDFPAEYSGKNNSLSIFSSGIRVRIACDNSYLSLFQEQKEQYKHIPCEFYTIERCWFSGDNVKQLLVPYVPWIIDSSSNTFNNKANQLATRLISYKLSESERVQVKGCLRTLREHFEGNTKVNVINCSLNDKIKDISPDFKLTVDLTTKMAWNTILCPVLKEIPFSQIGLGDQCIINTLLSIDPSSNDDKKKKILIIEEPESHLSHTKMYELLSYLSGFDGQMFVSTHSSFVANKLSLNNLIVLGKSSGIIQSQRISDFIDINGAADFWHNGKIIGNDAKNDNKVYVVKTFETYFYNGETRIPGSGISKKEITATVRFIKKNSGYAKAFQESNIAYSNSIQIESSESNREQMVSIISKDNGKGGEPTSNNMEYGGYISNGNVVEVESGLLSNPKTQSMATIMLPSDKSTFHSHPSGTIIENRSSSTNTINVKTAQIIYSFSQCPSTIDINNAGQFTHYVFGRSDSNVYVYTSAGIQAVIPLKYFVKPKQR